MIRFNFLAPGAKGRRRPVARAPSRGRGSPWRSTLVGFCAGSALAAACAVPLMVNTTHAARLAQDLDAQVAALRVEHEQLSRQAEEARQHIARLQGLRSRYGQRERWSLLLARVAAMAPPGLYVESMTYFPSLDTGQRLIGLRGAAASWAQLSAFAERLRDSGMFSAVEVLEGQSDEGGMVRFSLQLEMQGVNRP